MSDQKFKIGDRVRKVKDSQWTGTVVGAYTTTMIPERYAVESETERGCVQMCPAAELECAPSPSVGVDGLPEPAAWLFGASYWTRRESIPEALRDHAEPLYSRAVLAALASRPVGDVGADTERLNWLEDHFGAYTIEAMPDGNRWVLQGVATLRNAIDAARTAGTAEDTPA